VNSLRPDFLGLLRLAVSRGICQHKQPTGRRKISRPHGRTRPASDPPGRCADAGRCSRFVTGRGSIVRPQDRENLPRLGIHRASGRCSFRRNRSRRFPRANKVQFHPSPMRRSVHRPARELSTVGRCDRYRDPHSSIGRRSGSAAFSQSVGGRRTHRDISWRSSPKSSEFGIIDRHPIRHARTPASIAISQKLLLEARSSLVPLSHYFLLTCSASSARAGKPTSCLCADHLAVALA
jgi:hypothetical protein